MRSLLVELFRFGKEEGFLRQGDKYLFAAGSRRVCEVEMPLDYRDFSKHMVALRYKADAAARQNALQELGAAVTKLLRVEEMTELETGEFPLQLDLVLNAAELASLPFETAIDIKSEQLVARGPIVLTRRVRNDSTTVPVRWPGQPRILFAWARPEGSTGVPYQAHEEALRKALEPWAPRESTEASPATSNVLTIVERASLDAIRDACRKSVEEKHPFTYVHILAHGHPIGSFPEQQYGLALHAVGSDDLEPVPPEKISEALEPLRGYTVVVSLLACDSGNAENAFTAQRSVAHELHVLGFPVVIASQLPLTLPGSTIVVNTFYTHLLASQDVRAAVHESRLALKQSAKTTGHDWASLVAYVRLPEDYSDYLQRIRLESVLSSLKSIQSWSDELIGGGEIDEFNANYLISLLRGRSQELKSFLNDSDAGRRGIVEENYGLLGSTEKRIAELCYEAGSRCGSGQWRDDMKAALENARHWYEQGFRQNISSHWNGVQFMSLEAVLTGKISDRMGWYATTYAAQVAAASAGEFWAWGSLAELYLIGSAAGTDSKIEDAVEAVREMKRRVSDGNRFPLETTKRQFQRYVSWWTPQNGFPTGADLAKQAQMLVEALYSTQSAGGPGSGS
jgi:hypothetical protein